MKIKQLLGQLLEQMRMEIQVSFTVSGSELAITSAGVLPLLQLLTMKRRPLIQRQ